MCCLHFARPERFKYIAAHHPVGDAGRAEGNQQGRLTHSHLTSPQVPDAVQPRGKEGRKGNPPSCSRAAGYIPGPPTAKPLSWVKENGLSRMTSLSEATPASQHGTNSNAEQFDFGSAICSILP